MSQLIKQKPFAQVKQDLHLLQNNIESNTKIDKMN
jgi:hypothetical protein